jgi:hypothetical protein
MKLREGYMPGTIVSVAYTLRDHDNNVVRQGWSSITLDKQRGTHGSDLLYNIPNPYSGATLICYTGTETGPVQVAIMDVNGGLVKEINDFKQDIRTRVLYWDGNDQLGMPVPQGVYYYIYTINGRQVCRNRMIKLQ